MKKVIVLIVISFIVSMSSFWFTEGVFAFHMGSYSFSGKTHNHILRVSPRPPGWPQMWIAREIMKSLNENGVTGEKAKEEKGIELSGLPVKTNEAINFSISLNERNFKGCVFEFDKKKNFEKVLNHYLDLNKNNKLHTWSLVKDNILIVLEGSMPEQIVREYKALLAGIK